MEEVIGPDERAVSDDLASVDFLCGVDRGHWRLVERDGVIVKLEMAARGGAWVGVRLDCSTYPGVAPTGRLWSIEDDAPLAEEFWPTGSRASQVFNPSWSGQFEGAFYFPYDRRAVEGHDAWASAHPGYIWGPEKTIVDVLALLREVLRSATIPQRAATEAAEAS